MWKDLFNQALPGFEALFSALLLLGITGARKWIAAHTHNATETGILDRLTDEVAAVVREAEQTMVSEIKKGTDTSLSPLDATRVLNAALDNLKSHLGPDGIKRIEDVLKPADLNAMLITRIEAEVNGLRNSSGTVLAAAVASTDPQPSIASSSPSLDAGATGAS